MSQISNSTIRILESEPNKRGDLFGRLMGDLFLALGYDQARLNIHKSGREVDLEATHRIESRRVIAECKATKSRIGGDAVNKFIGVLDAEKRKEPRVPIEGYFISLSGFKESAIEQEKDAGGNRVILLNGNRVIAELIEGHIIVSPEKAMEKAGRCAAEQPADLRTEASCELLAHEIGWIWAIYFMRNKQRTHFALVHADGESIAQPLAEAIIQSDLAVGGNLQSLTYLPPRAESSISEDQIRQAKKRYFEYLASECGEITLEGLPADQEVGARRLKLENIFVPLYLQRIGEAQKAPTLTEEEKYRRSEQEEKERKHVGNVLSECSKLAILASPGGGKTTLLKRLAIAYAFPERRSLIDDKLPNRPWLPILLRCRQLGNMAKSPITEILRKIPQRAEMTDLEDAFKSFIDGALRSGNALFLVDGLDEISDESARLSFVNQLRTFLATYPAISVVVTSREAGFRIVGGALSVHCEHYRLADFDNENITRLTLAWHKEVVGDRQEVRIEAEKLAKTICDSDRVRQLAKNPLLLTTLLLVKRWVGQLPTRRSVLYGKAIEVLLMTWNVEGYEPIDQEEAIPQLAFVAFTLMKEGVQRISSRRLNEILILARKQMPEVLGYARFSVAEFIKRVELRSSLMIMSGHEVEQGTLYPTYEFRHLTFQEYLTARAIVDGYYPDRNANDTLLTILEPHLADVHWKEVIPLAAVLAGRDVQPLIQHLVDLCRKMKTEFYPHESYENGYPVILLSQCILDEIQVAPDLLENGLEWIARLSVAPSEIIQSIFRGKYGNILLKVVKTAYPNSKTHFGTLGGNFGAIFLDELGYEEKLTPQLVGKITALLADEDPTQRAAGALATMILAFYRPRPDEREKTEPQKLLKSLGDNLVPLLYSNKHYLQHSACWAFAWLGDRRFWSPKEKPEVLSRLLQIWKDSPLPDVQDRASWAIAALPPIDRGLSPFPEPEAHLVDFLKREFLIKERFRRQASLNVAYYLKAPWSDEELAKLLSRIIKDEGKRYLLAGSNITSYLKALGEPGRTQLEALEEKERSTRRPQPKAKGKKRENTKK